MFKFLTSVNILNKLIISFTIIFCLYISVSIYSLSQINTMKKLFTKLYNHPYTVSNTIKDINIDIISMHRYMKDIALSTNNIEIKRAVFLVNQHEENVFNSFKILEDRFLGDEGKVLIAKNAFVKWKLIREEVIISAERGDLKKAAIINKKKAYRYINSLQQKMKFLTDFATKKALDFYTDVLKTVEEIYFVIFLSLILIMAIGFIILYLITKYIIKQLAYLQKGVLDFFKYLNNETKSVSLLRIVSNDEIGKISQTINSNIKYTQNVIENEKKLKNELEKNQQQILELNKNLENRVKEEVDKNLIKEKLLFQQSKMAAMGEMIENIAHQWRQPLSVISTAAMGVKLKEEMDALNKDSINNSMDIVNASVQHLSQTINDFRDFFRTDKIKKEFTLENTIDKALKLLSSQFKTSNIIVVKKIENIIFLGLENELIQVLINILNNARDELMKETEEKKFILINIIKNKNLIEIRIKDNAGGIPNEIIKDIFNSHFTTKESLNGTGIGLYMSKIIIEDHMNGTIEVDNVNYTHENIVYTGAQFKITLPLR